MKRVFAAALMLLCLLTASCAAADITPPAPATAPEPSSTAVPSPSVSWVCTTPDAPWQTMDSLSLSPGKAAGVDIYIDTTLPLQEISGFGGAFNEQGWAALSVLSPTERDGVMKALFDPAEGARFNICRVPIGASDYALSRYTLNETPGDYAMEHFSIERDKEALIPYIKAAMAYQPSLMVWGSAWTPPTWMKTSNDFDGGMMKDDPQIYEAYALYLARFAEAYREQGIDIFAIAVQNEPGIERNYPTCLWSPEQYSLFITDYMGPLFDERKVGSSIMLGTHEDDNFAAFPMLLQNPDVSKYVSIVGYQWGGIRSVAPTRKLFPDKQIYQTETECGNFYWADGYNPDRPQNDWNYGVHTWNKVRDYFDSGVNAYMLWNMVLDEEGKSIDALSPWPQNAAVTVDKATGRVTYTPMFYAFKHFSYYVSPGARYLSTGGAENAAAFLNPDGSLVLELQNPDGAPVERSIKIDRQLLTVQLPAQSWSTFVLPG